MAARAFVLAVSFTLALGPGATAAPGAVPGSPPRSNPRPVELVDTAAVPGGHVAIVVDNHGIATAVWAEQLPRAGGHAPFTIRTSRRFRDGRWTTPRTIGCPPADACTRTRPEVGVDGFGRVTAVWSQGSRVETARRPDRGRWGEPEVLAQEPRDIPPAEVDLAVCRTGAAVVAWSSGDERFPVRVARRSANAPWRAAVSLNRGYDPHVAISDTGVVLVAQDDGSAHLSVRSHSPGAGWGRRHWLGRWPSYDPRVSFGPDGQALAVWSHTLGESGPSRVNGRERSPVARWTPGFRVSRTASASDDDVAGGVVIDSRGRETVALVRTAVDGTSTGLVLGRPADGRWTVQAAMPRLAGQAVDLLVNRHDDLALAFRDRVSLHRPGSPWHTTPGRRDDRHPAERRGDPDVVGRPAAPGTEGRAPLGSSTVPSRCQGVPVPRVCLSRLPDGRVLVVDGDDEHELATAELASYVAAREVDAPRWVWDDTARWYPPLLAAGVRVERCHDLGLCRRLLRRAPAVDARLLVGEQSQEWDRLGPSTPSDPALFSVDDGLEHLRADLEDARQLAAVAASTETSRLRLLLAAESSGALVAAEMTHAGVPWRVDVHERLLTDLLGPRPLRGARPAGLEALVAEVRAAFDAPGLNPDSRPELLAALRRAGLEVADTRASSLRALEHPGIPPLLRYKQLAHLFQTNGWTWIDQWVSGGRFRPSYQPAGSATGRWSSNGGGALSFPAQVRPAAVADEGWTFVVADVAQLEPRVLAGMSGDRALARSARGTDLYQGMVDDGAVATRKDAKLGLLGAMYGATSGESGRMVAGLTRRHPAAFGLVEAAARAGERGEGVRTLLGRGSPTLLDGPGDAWDRDPDDPPVDPDSLARYRRAFGRFTRNFVVQGTGAEWALCWIADLRNRLWRLGDAGPVDARPHLVFFLHDEVVVHTPLALADQVAAQATEAASTAGGLLFRELNIDFPLNVSVVRSYAEAGKPG